MKKVYLAGPITGSSWSESETWRDSIKRCNVPNVQFFSPLRGKEYLKDVGAIADNYSNTVMSTSKAIMTRDFYDVQTSDAVVVCLRGARRVSIGTVMEAAWAWQNRTPIIAIVDDCDLDTPAVTGFSDSPGSIHNHSMLNEAINWKVPSIEDAAEILRLLFNP